MGQKQSILKLRKEAKWIRAIRNIFVRANTAIWYILKKEEKSNGLLNKGHLRGRPKGK